MTLFSNITGITLSVALAFSSLALAGSLTGKTGNQAESEWQASWLNLSETLDFKRSEKIHIKVTGSAENVAVRLLPKGSKYESSDGWNGKVLKVPEDKILKITLQRDHPNVKQISVHGGKEVWDTLLGGKNGHVRLISVERLP